ncbi:hypothetical protein CRYUN_Cryun29cG0023300 [Craigia yunnanensis]
MIHLSTIEDSHFNKENLAGVVSSDKMLTDDGEVAKTNVESPFNAQNLEVLDQTLSTDSDKCESCDYDELTQNSNNDTKQSEVEGMPKATICHSFEAQRLNSVNAALSEMEGNRKCSLQQRVDNDAEVVELVEDLNGECMAKTPTDSDMSSRFETDDNRGNRVDCLSQGKNHAIEKSTNETFRRNNGQDSDKNLDSSPKNKLVRRYQPSSIFSYGSSGNDQLLKVEKSSKEKLLSPFFTSGKDTCMETFNGKSCPVERYTGDDIMLPVAAATATRCSSNHKLTQSPKQVADSPMIMDSQQEQGYLVKHAAIDTNQKLETSPENVLQPPAMSLTSLTNSRLLPREEGAKSGSYQLPLETEEHSTKSTVKCANSERQIEADSFVEASIPPGIPAASLKMGILKRKPCRCRDLLDCTACYLDSGYSFYRFSQHFVSMLKGRAGKIICSIQVKGACKKGSDAEELAKTHLSEMNYDLNIHCRIPVSTACTLHSNS